MTRANHTHSRAILQALAAAALFGLSTPLAKLLLGSMAPVLLAGLLYVGSGTRTCMRHCSTAIHIIRTSITATRIDGCVRLLANRAVDIQRRNQNHINAAISRPAGVGHN